MGVWLSVGNGFLRREIGGGRFIWVVRERGREGRLWERDKAVRRGVMWRGCVGTGCGRI